MIDVAGKIKEALQAEETLGVAADGSVSCTPEAEAKLSEQEKAAGDAAQGYFFEFFDTDKNPNMKLKMDAPLRKHPVFVDMQDKLRSFSFHAFEARDLPSVRKLLITGFEDVAKNAKEAK